MVPFNLFHATDNSIQSRKGTSSLSAMLPGSVSSMLLHNTPFLPFPVFFSVRLLHRFERCLKH